MSDTPADRLKAARAAAGYSSATKAAKAFGWPPSTYMGHENGSRSITVELAQRYARAFGADWTEILQGKSSSSASGAPAATPVLGYLGVRSGLADRATAPTIPVGAEGYQAQQLAAFIARPGPPLEYLICYTAGMDGLLEGDEIVISVDVPGHGRSYECWVISGERVHTSRWTTHIEFQSLDVEELTALPGFRAEGIVVAVYEDRKRKKVLDAVRVRKLR